MCQTPYCPHEMFEGKNIHYSSVDNKPLCSFSVKVCNQRRLNGYAFCVRHILEDYTAPFKRCAYVAKSSHQMCTQPIPKNQERVYCNNHMQVLGMMPKKKRKEKKEKDVNKFVNKESKLSFADRVKTKFNVKYLSKPQTDNVTVNVEDPYDPYAFSDSVTETPCSLSTSSGSCLPSPNTESVKAVSQSPGQVGHKTLSNEGTSSIAKLYPELAEKLEKIKPKPVEPKVKSRMRNTHNMKFYRLQTKIAQNRIKDKWRKSQETESVVNTPHVRSNLDVSSANNVYLGIPIVPPPYNGSTGSPGAIAPPHPLVQPLSYKATNPAGIHVPLSEPQRGLPPPPYPGVATGQPFNMNVPPMVKPSNEKNPVPVIPTPLTSDPVPPCQVNLFQLPPPPPYIHPKPPKKTSSPVLPVLCRQPQRLKCILFEKEAKYKLKSDSAVKYYSYHARRKISNHILINQGICSSGEESEDEDVDMLPWQPNWFSASSDDDNNDDDEEDDDPFDIPIHIRATKLALLRAKLRRQCHQCRTATQSNTTVKKTSNQEILALIQAAKERPHASVLCIQEILRKPRKKIKRYKMLGLEKRKCCHVNDSDVQCSNNVLPYTNHCLKHIMYNVDQQLFDYCTAKFADNTQCCVPIFDIKHELPLCREHGVKADNYQKIQIAEVRKRPRKKSKPPALSRPQKKNKKKKKGRVVRPQKPIPPSSPTGDISMPEAVCDVLNAPQMNVTTHEEKAASIKAEDSMVASTSNTNNNSKDSKMIDNNLGGVDLEETLGTVIDKNFELPLEQASRLLEEQDFQEVFNKIPDEAFDIFSSRNEPTAEETEELERALAAASSDIHAAKETLEQLVKGEISVDDIGEELTAILAQTLQANLQQDGALQMSGDLTLTSESATTLSRNHVYNEMGLTNSHPELDLNNVPTSINNVAYTRQVITGHGNLNTVENTGSTLSHSITTHKYYPVANGPSMSLPTQNVNSSRSYTVGPGMTLPYQANLPYTSLSQPINMSQQVRNVMPNSALRVNNQLISPSVMATHQMGNIRQSWIGATHQQQSVNYQNTNGYPSPRHQFIQNVNTTPMGKFNVGAQPIVTTDVTKLTNKNDTIYSQITHSSNVADTAATTGQGFPNHGASTFNSSAFTSSNTGS